MYNAIKVENELITEQKNKYDGSSYTLPKWVTFCEYFMNSGFNVYLYKAKTTFSKYIYLEKGRFKTKVRFSNHKPSREKENLKDSDYYVGVGNLGTVTTEQVIIKIEQDYKSKNEVNQGSVR